MKTSTMLLLGGAAVVGYLYATRKTQAAATSGLAAQAMTAQPTIVADQVTVNVEDDDYGYGYGPGWGVYGVPIFGGRRRHHHGHHGGGGHRYRGGGGGRGGRGGRR